MSKTKIKIHPAAELFPLMDETEYQTLLADVKANGLRFNVVFRGDELIDGRNRLRAIQELGLVLDDHREVFAEDEIPDPVGYVLSLNLHRRHLNESQRAMIAADVATIKNGENQHSMSQKEGSKICLPSTQNAAAELLHVSVGSVKSAKKVKENAVPEIVDAVNRGDVSVSAAEKVSKLPKSQQKKLAKAGPKAVKAAAAKSRRPGQPSGGTKFDPTEFDTEPEQPAEDKPSGNVPDHLKEIVSGTAEGRRIVRNIQTVLRDAKAFAETPAGTWLPWTDFEVKAKNLELAIKLSLFAVNCPVCKNKVTNRCGKCGGRGWIDKRHESQLTNEERAWLEAQK